MTGRHYFGTDGIRGVVGGGLINPEFLLRLGWAAGTVLAAKQADAKVLIGKDTRNSCDVLISALASGFMSAGVDVALIGVLPTPAVAHLAQSLHADAGVMISASHNGYQDNGVKFFARDGYKLDDATEMLIEKQLAQPLQLRSGADLGQFIEVRDSEGRYIEFCKQVLPHDFDFEGMTLVIDCANGATVSVAEQVFTELGANVVMIGDQPDGLNINQACGSTSVDALQQQVLAAGADAGLAFDGDGDRLLMVDNQGERVDGDELLCILACHYRLLADNQCELVGVVGTAMSNLGLEQALTCQGIAFERTAVGDRYVLERLLQKQWFLGGESSGHLVNLQHTTTGDGIISALQLLTIMQRSGQTLHALKQVMVKRPQVLINVPLTQPIDIASDPRVCQIKADAEQQLKDTGRVLLRASGTEPVIRVMVEGEDVGQVNKLAKAIAQRVTTVLSS